MNLVWLGVTLLLLVASDLPAKDKGIMPHSGQTAEDAVRADVEWPTPRRYAMILHEGDKTRTLHTVKDVLFAESNRPRSFGIVELQKDAVVLKESGTGRQITWRTGTALPDLPHRRLVGTVLLKQLRYRLKLVERVVHADPVLLTIQGDLAMLEQEVLKGQVSKPERHESPSLPFRTPPREVPVFLRDVRVKEVSPNTYEVQGQALQGSLENAGQLFSDLKLMVSPTLTSQAGLGYEVSSALADGRLDQGGFTVTNNKAAEMFGIERGDTILKVNGQTVNSPLNAWWAYQESVTKNPNQSEMRLDIRRGTGVITKTYRIK
jgi:hypothetical protein